LKHIQTPEHNDNTFDLHTIQRLADFRIDFYYLHEEYDIIKLSQTFYLNIPSMSTLQIVLVVYT